MSWKLRSVAGEAVRNFLSAPIRSVGLLCLFASLIGSLAMAELAFTGGLINFTKQYEQSGGYVVVASSDGGLSAARCEGLNSRPEIVAAGGVVETGSEYLATAPATIISTASVTSGLLAVLDPTAQHGAITSEGTAMGQALATELSLNAGTWINLDRVGPMPIGAVVDTEDRNPYVSRTLFAIAPSTGAVDECWVEFRPGAFNAALPYVQTLFSDAGSELSVRPWILLDEFSRNPTVDLANRTQRLAWILIAVLASLMAWLMIWFRRSELGLYRALGTARSAVSLLVQIEFAFVVALALPIGIAWATFIQTMIGSAPTTGQLLLSVRSATMAAAASVAIAPLAALGVGGHALLELLKDR